MKAYETPFAEKQLNTLALDTQVYNRVWEDVNPEAQKLFNGIMAKARRDQAKVQKEPKT